MATLQNRSILEAPKLSARSLLLRQRVEELEHLRQVAARHRDRAMVETIDAQIKFAVCEWIDSLIEGLEREVSLTLGKQQAA
jgi:hypothetical protein